MVAVGLNVERHAFSVAERSLCGKHPLAIISRIPAEHEVVECAECRQLFNEEVLNR